MGETHGKLGAVYRLRPSGFKGSGLNDVIWGTGFSGAASAYYEVVIDAESTPDTFKWRKNGGGWTAGVAITGAAQTLDDGQQITFAATTGHTLADQWTIGNLKDEACTESGADAQITAAAKRFLNPNVTITFTDSGGKKLLRIDHVIGTGRFDENVTVVTVTGNNGFLVESGLQKVGYLYDWGFEPTVELAEKTAFQDKWKKWLAGLAEAKGSAEGYLPSSAWFDDFKKIVDGTQDYFFVQLFSYDPDDDQTGDHFNCWVVFSGINVNAPVGEIVKEKIDFQIEGMPAFKANV